MADSYIVERSTAVRAAAADVFPHLADFHQWPAWSPWEGLDPEMQRTYAGAESGTGATYAWSGNRKAGAGRMEITEAVEPSQVTIALDFLKPFKSSSIITFALKPDGEATRVTWKMTGPMTPMTRIMGIFKSMDKMVGPDFEKGLEQLKAEVERSDA